MPALPRIARASLTGWAASFFLLGTLVAHQARAEDFESPGASPVRLPSPAAGERLEPGIRQVVSLTGRFLREASEATEGELLLSLDGGATFPLRLTRSAERGEPELVWRVPRLPTSHARLAVRTDSGEDEEIVSALSAEFTILPPSGLDLEDLARVEGEWRTREALERPPQSTQPFDDSLRTPREHVSPDDIAPDPGEGPHPLSAPDPSDQDAPLIRQTRRSVQLRFSFLRPRAALPKRE